MKREPGKQNKLTKRLKIVKYYNKVTVLIYIVGLF